MTTTTTSPRRGFKRARKVGAALVGMALVGGAAYAALSWYQARGTGSANAAVYSVDLIGAPAYDHAAADPEEEGADARLADGGGALNYLPVFSVASAATTVTATDAFTVDLNSAYPGYVSKIETQWERRANGIPMRLQAVTVVQPGTDLPFAAGTAPVVAWLDAVTCGVTLDNTDVIDGSPDEFGDVWLMATDQLTEGASVPFDVLVQWVPQGVYSAASCNSTIPATTAAP